MKEHTTNRPILGLYADMQKQPHILIAGATGSGKSVIINGFIMSLLAYDPQCCDIWLCDPKRVDYQIYRKCENVKRYANTTETIAELLQVAVAEMMSRYRHLERNGKRKGGKHLFIIVDEIADLMTSREHGRNIENSLIRLSQLARACNIHLITATQRPTADIINKRISVNMVARIGLRTDSAQDSRNILGCPGCERLPRYGKALYKTPDFTAPQLVTIPNMTDSEIAEVLKHYPKRIIKAR